MIIDDSAVFRQQIHLALKDCHQIEIVGSVSNGKIALERMAMEHIDVCSLDIEMPVMDGIETLKHMREKGVKTKAIMFSTLSKAGAEKTLEALSQGAADFVPKPTHDDSNLSPAEKIKEMLLPKILTLGKSHSEHGEPKPVVQHLRSKIVWETFRPDVMVIASSTGGPNALIDFFAGLTDYLPFPVLIAQHMPPLFTASLAERIGKTCGKISKEAVEGEVLKPNHVYVAPGNFHMKLTGDKHTPTVMLDQSAHRNYIRPCADYLFETAASIFGRNTLGIVLTGMGRDGADGARAIKTVNGAVLIQNEQSCVVFGMPGAVFEAGDYDFQGTPQEIAVKAKSLVRVRRLSNVS